MTDRVTSKYPSASIGIIISAAHPEDRDAIADLLRAADLPAEDFAAHLRYFLVARQQNEIVGAIGAEVYGGHALLRSLVVAPKQRGSGLGKRLLQELERAGGPWGVKHWWLLTTTAEAFFKRRGFVAVPRNTAPATIAGTAEFRDLCPSVALCLTRERSTI